MASVRRLKKDVDYLTYAVVGDCLIAYTFNEDNGEKIENIMEKIVANRNDLRDRISQAPSKSTKKETKQYYKQIFKELLEGVDSAFVELSDLVSK